MILRLPMRAAMLSAVSPQWSCAFTISLMKRPMPILAGALKGPVPFVPGGFWLLGALPWRTTHSSKLSR